MAIYYILVINQVISIFKIVNCKFILKYAAVVSSYCYKIETYYFEPIY